MSEAKFLVEKFKNGGRTFLLFLGMVVMMVGLGYLFFGISGLIWAGVLGVFGLYASYRIPANFVMKMKGGRVLNDYEIPRLSNLVKVLSKKAGLNKSPKLYFIASNQFNAFATGSKNDPAIAITQGALQFLDERELTGVLAHEISHIANNDLHLQRMTMIIGRLTRLFSLMGQLLLLINLPLLLADVGSISWVAILLLIFAPMLSTIMMLAISRTREFDADLNAARITSDPLGLARALNKLSHYQQHWFPKLQGRLVPRFLQSHPTLKERIRRLQLLGTKYKNPTNQYSPLSQLFSNNY
ncbi:MAG: peptidase M48 [Saprospiraceae bacterium]|nr:MAG: peptidase M48 [Saprospiraceae bacterium]